MKKLLVALSMLFTLAQAGSLYQQGSKTLSINASTGTLDIGVSKDYLVLGIHGEYFLIDNFSLGLGLSAWVGDDPTLTEISLPATYYFETNGKLYPYLGAFYNYSFYSGEYVDLSYSSVGGRVGVTYKSGKGYIGIGVSAEYNVDTEENYVNPEVFAGIVF